MRARAVTQRSSARIAAAIVCLAVAFAAASSARADDATRLVLKAGGEYDTNARRLVGAEPVADELVRLFLKADVERALGDFGRGGVKLLLGGKLYQDVDEENTLLSSITASWSRILAVGAGIDGEGLWLGVWLRGDFADRSEQVSTRDYLRAGGVAGLHAGWGPVSLSAGGGYRAFVYKPDLASNHHGASAEVGLGVDIWEGLRGRASYVFIARDFDVERLLGAGDGVIVLDVGGELRRDALHATRLELGWRGAFLLAASYGLQINTSNSFGPGLVRHIGEASWTQPLWWGLRLAVTGRLQRTLYDDPVRIDETLQIDDEDRNQLVVGLNIPVPPLETGLGLERIFGLELRYSLYTEALGRSEADFVRHLVYVGLSAELDPLLQ